MIEVMWYKETLGKYTGNLISITGGNVNKNIYANIYYHLLNYEINLVWNTQSSELTLVLTGVSCFQFNDYYVNKMKCKYILLSIAL